ncbi:MAG TPA: acetyl-CoA carboxylase carboxyltransferase subunit alpha [Gemmatales bacterium]|nr:acetyl-CoA carboxylase carboxyltransferase subunit alpha [Gemmatales bacterium]
MPSYLPFEKDIAELETMLRKLEEEGGAERADEVRRMQKEVVNLKKKKFASLTPWQSVQVSRHPERPQYLDYVQLMFDEYTELHGDKAIGDDRSLRTGLARLDDMKVMLIGHHKGRNLHERQECFYGCAHPEGYRKALMRMKFAAKFGLPVICLIDTPGAYPGIGAEERGQAQLIAANLLDMSRIPTPIVCVVIGEGGSGGALGIGIGDRVCLLEYAYYSVISPEGCAGILWKTATEETKARAAEALKLTAKHLLKLNVIDEVVPEPLGGAHRDPREMANTLKSHILKHLRELRGKSHEQLLAGRYQKFRQMGVFERVAV